METLDLCEPKEMSGEKGALDCWDFQVNPLFLEELISPCLNGISYEEWMSLDTNDSGSEVVVLLSDMCSEVIITNSNLILEIVEPLIFTSGHDLSCGNDATVQGGCSNFKVMEENIEACFGNSLNQYFVEVLDIAEGSCDTLDELVRLFSAEVTKKVNLLLAQVTGSTLSLNTCDSLRAASTLQMVDTIGKLFKDVLEGFKIMDESCDELACPPCNSQERWCFDSEDAENVEEDSTEISGFSFSFSKMPKLDNLHAPSVPQHSDDSESNDDINPISSDPPPDDYNKTFLTMLLRKLVNHIASETGTSLENVNLNDLVSCVTWCTRGMLDLSPLRSVDNLHISIYESLCQKFRAKHVLQVAMVSHDSAFEFAVIMTLLSQLEKYNTSKEIWDLWNPFKPGNLSPEPHREERSTQTSPSPPKRSLCSTLRKKFSRWASNVVNFFKRSGQ
ncbi:uncharacterized protein LOC115789967 [Archocentrus centrarchus]|uniref:uncharacterized protein LOC115789967 n=1 Tax=Archocentrus centrarchus TaxID=63155 RepID=UPI0011EA2B14|nr:uncharacterized protein LOC115789967 [Archocentrus centrarchus]